MHPSIERVARRFFAVASTGLTVEDVQKAGWAAAKAVRDQLPGLGHSLEDESARTWPGYGTYKYGPPPEAAYLRLQLPDEGVFMGIFPTPAIPFQAGWDTKRKQYRATSFKVEHKFRSLASVIAFMANPAKVKAFVRKGLKTVDAGERAFYLGKLTPEGVVNRVLKVDARFNTVDEWHYTELTILLMMRTAKKVPQKLIERWLKDNWGQVRAKASSKTPAAAGRPERYASARTAWDDDDDDDYRDDGYDDGDWMMDYPKVGLGWLVPNQLTWGDLEQVDVQQEGRRATVTTHSSIR